MAVQKQVTIKLFFNRSSMSFYAQIGDSLFMVKDRIAQILHDKEDLEIRHGNDIREIQDISNEDESLN